MSTLIICDCCGFADDEAEPCVEYVDTHHCQQCICACRPCVADRAEDRSAQVALDIVRGK